MTVGSALLQQPTVETHQFEFTGRAGEYFRIWIVNLGLTVVTLGLYSPWAKVRTIRWMSRNTCVGGAAFDYTADPWRILRGRLIALGVLLVSTVGAQVVPILGAAVGLAVFLAGPWMIVRARALRLHHTVYRNIRFAFAREYGQAAKIYALYPALSVLSLGLFVPRAALGRYRFVVSNKTMRSTRRQALCRFLICVAGVFAPVLAHAHFILVAPDSWMSQDSFGFPEKHGPCGNEPGGTPTGKVTAFRPGETISVTINEVVPHPGHYRVALAGNDRSELPAEPTVTPNAADPCASAAVENPPTFPILADNMVPHTRALVGPQTFTITLPTNVSCAKCTLQVLEFMSHHPTPCFYYHCADISILGPNGSTTTTTQPCSTPRCSVEAVMQGPACGSDIIPAATRRKLDRASELLVHAETSLPRKAKVLRRKAKRALKRTGGSALRASKKARLSAGCAASIKETTDQLAGAL